MDTRYVRFIDKRLHFYMMQLAYEAGVSYESVKVKTFTNGIVTEKFYEFVIAEETRRKIGDYLRKQGYNKTA